MKHVEQVEFLCQPTCYIMPKITMSSRHVKNYNSHVATINLTQQLHFMLLQSFLKSISSKLCTISVTSQFQITPLSSAAFITTWINNSLFFPSPDFRNLLRAESAQRHLRADGQMALTAASRLAGLRFYDPNSPPLIAASSCSHHLHSGFILIIILGHSHQSRTALYRQKNTKELE